MHPPIRTACITGGTQGLGLALVLRLARSGTTVYTVARRRRGIEALRRLAREEALPVHVLQGDLIALGTPRRLVRRVVRDGVTLDLVVHNAGLLGPRVPLTSWSRRTFDAVMSANLSAPFDLTRRLVPHCAPGATIVFVSSGVTTGVRSDWGAYQVSKVALENLAATFAAELPTTGPLVAIIDPGRMRTAMRAAAYPDEDPAQLPDADQVAVRLLEVVARMDRTMTGRRFDASVGS
jgi:NAD(P)-dependent dehydrogenase (short-subunit alcohol dehydrogenase family)